MKQPDAAGPGTPSAGCRQPAGKPDAPPSDAPPSDAPSSDPPAGPLSGLLVADFSRVLAGPYCTMLLADLGADVIKVESPAGDDTRRWMPPVTGDGRIDVLPGDEPEQAVGGLRPRDEAPDLAAARELARRADVLVQNFKPGGLARFGLDYESVAAANPTIIYASISGFGSGRREGPARLRPDGAGDVRADEPDRAIRPGRRTGPASRYSTSSPACTRRSAYWPPCTTAPPPAAGSTSRPA